MVFICHGLGGLVCANALLTYHETNLAGASLTEKTRGIIFLGTPFKGSSKTNWARTALRMLDWLGTTHEDGKDLEERSTKLMSVNDAFQKFLKAR